VLNLKLEDIETLNTNGQHDGSRVFLEIELKNGVTFRDVYWTESNTFHFSIVGDKHIKDILEYELSNLRKNLHEFDKAALKYEGSFPCNT